MVGFCLFGRGEGLIGHVRVSYEGKIAERYPKSGDRVSHGRKRRKDTKKVVTGYRMEEKRRKDTKKVVRGYRIEENGRKDTFGAGGGYLFGGK